MIEGENTRHRVGRHSLEPATWEERQRKLESDLVARYGLPFSRLRRVPVKLEHDICTHYIWSESHKTYVYLNGVQCHELEGGSDVTTNFQTKSEPFRQRG